MRTPALVLVMLALLSAPLAAEPTRFAIVVGCNPGPKPKSPALRYADDDACATQRLFAEAGIRSQLLVELDEDSRRFQAGIGEFHPPTKANLYQAFASLRAEMQVAINRGEQVEFLFFYSGHGEVENGEGYLVMQDGRLTRSQLMGEIIGRSPATRNHVIIDACKSFYLAFGKGVGGARSRSQGGFVLRHLAELSKRTGFILSTSSDRDSHEWERFQGGVFSHAVRSALRGAADVDQDGRITYAELGGFLKTSGKQIQNPRYRPDFSIRPPGSPPGDLDQTLLHWEKTSNQFLMDLPGWGHVYLEDQKGERLLDANPAAEAGLIFHLPTTRLLFLRQADDSRELVVTGSVQSTSTLTSRPVQVARKGALHLAFEKLFSEPFGQASVAAFREEYQQRGDPLLELSVHSLSRQDPWRPVQTISGWTALGATAVGVAANLWAFGIRREASGGSQQERDEANQSIQNLNTTALVFYGLAGAAAVTWLTLMLLEDDDGESGLELIPALAPGSAGVIIRGHFGK